MVFDSFVWILSASWIVPACRRQVWRHYLLVNPQREKKNSFHLSASALYLLMRLAFLNSTPAVCFNISKLTIADPGCADNTTSRPIFKSAAFAISRNLRFTWLRLTAFPTLRPTTMPILVFLLLLQRTLRINNLLCQDCPAFLTSRNVSLLVKRRGFCIAKPYTVNFALPLNLRLLSTALPWDVLILVRKPCTLRRRRFFGWYVLLGIYEPHSDYNSLKRTVSISYGHPFAVIHIGTQPCYHIGTEWFSSK